MSDSEKPVALQLRNVAKAFQGQWALRGVDLELHAGEVHALLGQNGSGKSTLIKILAGYHQPEAGATALREGRPFDLGSAAQAHAGGVRFIHQDLALIDELDVCDNVALGERYQGRWWLSERRERAAIRRVLEDYDLDVDVGAAVRTLGPAQRALTAIVRALHHAGEGPTVLVLDEPTAALPAHEVENLFALIRRVRDRGGAVLYVTHRLQEVFQIADRVTVLRDGKRVDTTPVQGLEESALIEKIIGRPLEALYTEPPPARDDVVLAINDLTGQIVQDVNVDVHAGEIVGVTGLVGSGAEELLHLTFGAEARVSGRVCIEGREVRSTPHDAVEAGLAFAPADRKRLGGISEWTLTENVTLPRLKARRLTKWLGGAGERADASVWLRRFEVSPVDPSGTFSSLSGGNQQKTVLARWLRCGARTILLEEPTQGVDIGAKASIYSALAEVAAQGAAILMFSTDAEELVAVCDRVLVFRDGSLVADLPRSAATVDRVTAECVRGGNSTEFRERSHA